MSVKIQSVQPGSIAERAGIQPGEELLEMNGQPVRDVLDYRFYMVDTRLKVLLRWQGQERLVHLRKQEYDDLGLEFETYLMDKQHHCFNKCVFCFVDQLPKGLRESLYFKDDDSRMSFLFGSYVTLTNVSEEEIRRIIKMHISPINISVHTTNPELRVSMLHNPHAGECLRYLDLLAEAGIKINTQLVLCPGINDGEEMRRTLYDLEKYRPSLQSIALVPVGLTKHRANLYPLHVMSREEAQKNLDIAEEFGQEMLKKHGTRLAFPADEMFLLAGQPIPPVEYYEDCDQLEDGVGLCAVLEDEFMLAFSAEEPDDRVRELSLACGKAPEALLSRLADKVREKFPHVRVHVYGVENQLFGETVTVSGLLCGHDLAQALRGQELGSKLLIPSVMLRHEMDTFLDDTDVPWLSEQLKTPVQVLEIDGGALLDAMIE